MAHNGSAIAWRFRSGGSHCVGSKVEDGGQTPPLDPLPLGSGRDGLVVEPSFELGVEVEHLFPPFLKGTSPRRTARGHSAAHAPAASDAEQALGLGLHVAPVVAHAGLRADMLAAPLRLRRPLGTTRYFRTRGMRSVMSGCTTRGRVGPGYVVMEGRSSRTPMRKSAGAGDLVAAQ